MSEHIPRSGHEDGFSMIELLVVILVIGILAAIAIPSFLNQTSKANDASAKELVRSSETAAETYATDHSGDYGGMDVSALVAIEPTIATSSAGTVKAFLSGVSNVSSDTYTVTTTSASGNTYSITRTSDGTTVRTCTGTSGGCTNLSW